MSFFNKFKRGLVKGVGIGKKVLKAGMALAPLAGRVLGKYGDKIVSGMEKYGPLVGEGLEAVGAVAALL